MQLLYVRTVSQRAGLMYQKAEVKVFKFFFIVTCHAVSSRSHAQSYHKKFGHLIYQNENFLRVGNPFTNFDPDFS